MDPTGPQGPTGSMGSIAQVQLDKVKTRLLDTHNMTLDVSSAAASSVADIGYDPRYGARPLKRCVQSHVLNPLSKLVLEGGVLDGETVRVRTLGEVVDHATNENGEGGLGWTSYRGGKGRGDEESDMNAIVLLRNHIKDTQ